MKLRRRSEVRKLILIGAALHHKQWNGRPYVSTLIDQLLEHLKVLDQQVDEIATQIKAWHRSNEASQRLGQVPGIGPLTASAMVSIVGNARSFKNGRELAAWLGLVPCQHSSGGKPSRLRAIQSSIDAANAASQPSGALPSHP